MNGNFLPWGFSLFSLLFSLFPFPFPFLFSLFSFLFLLFPLLSSSLFFSLFFFSSFFVFPFLLFFIHLLQPALFYVFFPVFFFFHLVCFYLTHVLRLSIYGPQIERGKITLCSTIVFFFAFFFSFLVDAGCYSLGWFFIIFSGEWN